MPDREELQSGKPARPDTVQEAENGDRLKFGLFGKSILQSLPVGVVTFAADLKIIEANPEASRLVELDETIDAALARGTAKTGMEGTDWAGYLHSVMSTGKARSFDSITYISNGETKLLRVLCTPLREIKTNKVFGGTAVIEDITEKVNVHRQLAEMEKLATVGKLASKVAHELNNPMDGILRYINLTLRIIKKENLEKPKEYLSQCRQGLMRMVQIVSELLEFSRSTYTPFEYVRIEQIIEDAIKTMGFRAEASNVRFLRNYTSNVPQLRSGSLFQVFCNLIKNAMDAMPDGGELKISTYLTDENTVVAEFRDTGVGFAPEHAGVLFEPFFTTKEKGKGTGLGLAVCKDIIERYHGRITAENAPEGGSIFTVYLPVANENS